MESVLLSGQTVPLVHFLSIHVCQHAHWIALPTLTLITMLTPAQCPAPCCACHCSQKVTATWAGICGNVADMA